MLGITSERPVIEAPSGTAVLVRTTDLETVREILISPSIYSLMGDDYAPPPHEFEVNRDPRIRYVLVYGGKNLDVLGLFTLLPQNRVCFEVHVAMLPWARPAQKWAAARALPDWLAANTECRRLTAAVPDVNRPAIIYGTHGLGMRYAGRQEAAFMRHGKLRDLVLLGRSIG